MRRNRDTDVSRLESFISKNIQQQKMLVSQNQRPRSILSITQMRASDLKPVRTRGKKIVAVEKLPFIE